MDLVYRNDLFLRLPTGIILLSLARLFLIFSLACFRAVPQITERLEEAKLFDESRVSLNFIDLATRVIIMKKLNRHLAPFFNFTFRWTQF